ncbi:MAGE family member A10, variant 2 [Balamuthia mandrillaris]
MALLLKVAIVDRDFIKTIKFNLEDSIEECLKEVHHVIKQPYQPSKEKYALFVNGVRCQEDLPLSSFKLKNLDRVEFRKLSLDACDSTGLLLSTVPPALPSSRGEVRRMVAIPTHPLPLPRSASSMMIRAHYAARHGGLGTSSLPLSSSSSSCSSSSSSSSCSSSSSFSSCSSSSPTLPLSSSPRFGSSPSLGKGPAALSLEDRNASLKQHPTSNTSPILDARVTEKKKKKRPDFDRKHRRSLSLEDVNTYKTAQTQPTETENTPGSSPPSFLEEDERKESKVRALSISIRKLNLSAGSDWVSKKYQDRKKGESADTSTSAATNHPDPSANHVFLVVESVEQKLKRTLKMDKSARIADIIANWTKKNPIEDMEDYGLVQKDDKQRERLDPSTTISSYNFAAMTVLMLTRLQMQVTIELEWSSTTMILTIDPQIKIKKLVKRIMEIVKRRETIENPEEYCLFLPHKKNPCEMVADGRNFATTEPRAKAGILMDLNRTVQSYRLCKDDILQFRRELTVGLASDSVFITIDAPCHERKLTFQFKNDTLVQDIYTTFLKKAKLRPNDCEGFYLFVKESRIKSVKDKIVSASSLTPKRRQGGSNSGMLGVAKSNHTLMDAMQPLSTYITYNLSKIVFLQKIDPSRAPTMGPESNTVFGVEPTSLKQTEDNGFVVPLVLAQLRHALYANEGISEEGIFRLAGDELLMNKLKKQLNNGSFMPDLCTDANTAATLIKVSIITWNHATSTEHCCTALVWGVAN